jgi:hypothetical protein
MWIKFSWSERSEKSIVFNRMPKIENLTGLKTNALRFVILVNFKKERRFSVLRIWWEKHLLNNFILII